MASTYITMSTGAAKIGKKFTFSCWVKEQNKLMAAF